MKLVLTLSIGCLLFASALHAEEWLIYKPKSSMDPKATATTTNTCIAPFEAPGGSDDRIWCRLKTDPFNGQAESEEWKNAPRGLRRS